MIDAADEGIGPRENFRHRSTSIAARRVVRSRTTEHATGLDLVADDMANEGSDVELARRCRQTVMLHAYETMSLIERCSCRFPQFDLILGHGSSIPASSLVAVRLDLTVAVCFGG